MALVLNEVRHQGTYNGVDRILLGESAVNAVRVNASILAVSGAESANGLRCYLKVVYVDKTTPARSRARELGIWRYNEADNSVIREGVLASSNGGNLVDWDTGSNEVVVYSVIPGEIFGVQTLQQVVDADPADAQITSITPVQVSEITITPKSSRSQLNYSVVIDSRIRKLNNGNSVASVRGRFFLQFENTAGVWIPFGLGYFLGYDFISVANASTVIYQPTIISGIAGNTFKNPAGDWRIRTVGEVDYADNRIDVFNTVWTMEEEIVI